MKWIEKLIRIFREPAIDNISFHECGHLIVSLIFSETTIIQFVSISDSNLKQYDQNALGGLKGKAAKPISEFSIYDYDNAILISLAGICADDINNSDGNIDSSFYKIITWANKFNEFKYSGDIEFATMQFERIKSEIKIKWPDYISETLKFLHDILNDDLIWEVLNILKVCWGIGNIRDRINFVVTKLQRCEQTVFGTDRSPMGGNFTIF